MLGLALIAWQPNRWRRAKLSVTGERRQAPIAVIQRRVTHKVVHETKWQGFEGCRREAAIGAAEPKPEGSSLADRQDVPGPRDALIQRGPGDDHERCESERP